MCWPGSFPRRWIRDSASEPKESSSFPVSGPRAILQNHFIDDLSAGNAVPSGEILEFLSEKPLINHEPATLGAFHDYPSLHPHTQPAIKFVLLRVKLYYFWIFCSSLGQGLTSVGNLNSKIIIDCQWINPDCLKVVEVSRDAHKKESTKQNCLVDSEEEKREMFSFPMNYERSILKEG